MSAKETTHKDKKLKPQRVDVSDWDDSVRAYRFGYVGAVLHGEGHSWVGDEQKRFGGGGMGPSPFTQLYGALAHCTISTLAARARAENIPLEACDVHVRGLVNLPNDGLMPSLEDDENIDIRIVKLVRHITVAGELSPDQLERLKWVAEHCPVHRSIEGGCQIRTQIEHVRSNGTEGGTP